MTRVGSAVSGPELLFPDDRDSGARFQIPAPMNVNLGQAGQGPRTICSTLGCVAAVSVTESPSHDSSALIQRDMNHGVISVGRHRASYWFRRQRSEASPDRHLESEDTFTRYSRLFFQGVLFHSGLCREKDWTHQTCHAI